MAFFQIWQISELHTTASCKLCSEGKNGQRIQALQGVLGGCLGNPKITRTKFHHEGKWNKSIKIKILLVKTPSTVQNYEKIIKGKLTLMIEFWFSDFWVASTSL